MNPSQRDKYLKAMQIDTWVPRVALPYAALSEIMISEETLPINPIAEVVVEETPLKEITLLEKNLSETIVEKKEQSTSAPIQREVEQNPTTDEIPNFSLQLMKAGNTLLLIDLPQGKALHIDDKNYQLLRNILRAAQLPDSPEWLSDIIHWPLFKQASIPQGRHEAKEFLQSFIKTYQEQLTDAHCLWLIGDSAIRYTAQLDESNYYQIVSDQSLGKLLIVPALATLLNNPDKKAKLWQSIKSLLLI